MLFISVTVILLTSTLILVAIWCRRTYTFWHRHGIPYVKPIPLIGTLKDVLTFKKNVGVHIADIYQDPVFAQEPVVGIYMLHQPALLIRDPELIKSMFSKNFQNFHDRYGTVDVEVDPFGALNIFFAKYQAWSKMRQKFSPAFSTGKLKQAYPLMLEVAQNMEKYLLRKGDNYILEVRKLCGLYTTDQIATIAYGIQAHSFDEKDNKPNVFAMHNEANMKDRPTYKIIVMLLLPQLAKLLRAELFTQKYRNFLRTSLNNIIEDRQKSGIIRNDLIDTLIKLREEAVETVEENDKKVYDDMLLAQVNVFYLAGFETTMSFLTYTLYLLAKHPEIQKRLRQEIKCVLKNKEGHISYDSLKSFTYLDMVMQESLRLHPVVPYLERVHNEHDPVLGKFSLKPYHGFEMPNGMPIFVSVLALHNDPTYWPNPEVFDPDRFAPGKEIPAAYCPFGVGPHNCIGSRLAIIKSKLGFIYILKNFEVRICSQTIMELTTASNTISLACHDDIHLQFVKDVLWEFQQVSFEIYTHEMLFIPISLILLTSILSLVIVWIKRTYTFWQRHDIPYVKPLPFIGTLKGVLKMKKNVGVHFADIYNDPKFLKEPVVGIYMLHQPALLIRDPDLIKAIFIKRFQNFHDRYATIDVDVDPFGALNMFFSKYKTWSEMRPKFSPAFTTGKLKQALPMMIEVAQNMEKYLLTKGDKFILDVKELCGLYTTDQISAIAFGILAHSFNDSNDNPNVFALQNEENIRVRPAYKNTIMLLLPRLAKFFRAELFTKKYEKFLRSSLNDILEERKNSGTIRNDLIDILMKLRQEAEETVEECDKKSYDDMLFAQVNIFYLAGYETTMSFLAYTLYLLAKYPKIQKRLRHEIKTTLISEKGNITYESLKSLPYMHMIMQESLRMYAVVPYLEREHNCDDPVLGKFSLKPYYDFEIPAGMPIFVSPLAMHRDPKYWPNPDVFDPERFAPGKPIPGAYLPFGAGPHNCIGERLAKIKSKVAFLHILKNFEIRECNKTAKNFTIASNTISLACEEDINLEFVKDVLWE
ncbi:uncharacterized protein LOC142232746 [Haematobia irritans]|uniref:uncharacterized protein LOC142232746 n=1 Tax=Haematobia irritans TaxID=7368 RepID=UPI003F4F8D56